MLELRRFERSKQQDPKGEKKMQKQMTVEELEKKKKEDEE